MIVDVNNERVATELETNKAQLEELLCGMVDTELKDDLMEVLLGSDYLVAPASAKYHGSFLGGLFRHSYEVAKHLQHMTDAGVCNEWMRPDSPIVVGLIHDLCKVDKYRISARKVTGVVDGPVYNVDFYYNEDHSSFGGHGSDSLIKALMDLYLTEEECLCIRYHMGAYEKSDWDGYDKAIKKFPNVLWTHTADMYASKVLGV